LMAITIWLKESSVLQRLSAEPSGAASRETHSQPILFT
jgi:hypothetical protein